MNPGGTHIFKGTQCKALKTPLFCSFLAQLPLKSLLCQPQDPMCFDFFVQKLQINFVTQWPQCFWFFDKNITLCSKNKTVFTNFHPNLWQNTFKKKKKKFGKTHFFSFCVTKCPLTLKIRAVHPRLFYMVVPGDLNKYLDDNSPLLVRIQSFFSFLVLVPFFLFSFLFCVSRLYVSHNA